MFTGNPELVVVPRAGLEPAWAGPVGFKSTAYANSATGAFLEPSPIAWHGCGAQGRT